MDATMIEKVARAICCPEGCAGDTGSGRPCNIVAEDATAIRQARAAIEAMRSPTDEMITAICGGRFIENDGEGGAWIDADGAAWLMDAVVNAALNPQTSP